MQLIKQNPEMPGTIELNRERRKQLAEIMPEYPTKADEEDQRKQTHEEKESTHAYSAEDLSVQYEEN